MGRPGRNVVKKHLKEIIERFCIDITIANGENAAGGNGLTKKVAEELYSSGIDFLTMGNHVWDKKEIVDFIDSDSRIVRPANYPAECPGKGSMVINKNDISLGVINVSGRIFLDPLNCPFMSVETEISKIKDKTNCILVDFHAEATSEKVAMGWFLAGKVSAVVGTHTHIQTADECILPGSTAYITDVGMTGPYNSVLGVETDIILKKFLTQMPVRFEVAKGPAQINAVVIEIDDKLGKAKNICRLNLKYDNI